MEALQYIAPLPATDRGERDSDDECMTGVVD